MLCLKWEKVNDSIDSKLFISNVDMPISMFSESVNPVGKQKLYCGSLRKNYQVSFSLDINGRLESPTQ